MAKNGRVYDLVGTSEAAEVLGVEKPRIGRYIRTGKMPTPVALLGATPVWNRGDVEALRDAMAAARSGHPEMRVAPARALDIVGTREAAEMLGVERTRIGRWLRLGRMPEPLARLHATPIWLRKDLEKFRDRLVRERAERQKTAA
jgi:predicted DNA-binding transcriptional regulator AlpA